MDIYNCSKTLTSEKFSSIRSFMEDAIVVSKDKTELLWLAHINHKMKIWRKDWGLQSFYQLSQTTPIFIVDKEDVEEYNCVEKWAIHNDYKEGICVDLLGLYCSGDTSKSYICLRQNNAPDDAFIFLTTDDLQRIKAMHRLISSSGAWIILFADTIKASVANAQELHWLMTKVLIHELMHGLMDTNRNCDKPCPSKIPYLSKFGRYCEESFANALTAYYINYLEQPDFLNYSLNFMDRQPFEYQLGAKLYRRMGSDVTDLARRYVQQKRRGSEVEFKAELQKEKVLLEILENNMTQMSFSQKVIESLGCYVYALVDPRNNKIFYIGKGGGKDGRGNNRVFQHVKCTLDKNDKSLKLDTIKEIKQSGNEVKYYILRHNLTEQEAFLVESTLIDFLTYPDFNLETTLTNIAAGHHQWEDGVKTVQEINLIYNCAKIAPAPDETLLLVSLNRTFDYKKAKKTPDVYVRPSLYDATRKYWRISKNRIKDIKYVLGVYKGIVRSVYEPTKWYIADFDDNGVRFDKPRWAFEGKEVVDSYYLNKSVVNFPFGSGGAIRYIVNGK